MKTGNQGQLEGEEITPLPESLGGLVIPSQKGRNQPFGEPLLVAVRLTLGWLFPEQVLSGGRC